MDANQIWLEMHKLYSSAAIFELGTESYKADSAIHMLRDEMILSCLQFIQYCVR